ncbi:uncharacterized protein LOC120350934 isoform X2 [Nilaparvata lugens]|uniref:uncharacterized protein LOC120350934 isoform X2 n=1 Tax=Nilaparvata lugens TaxID=108931 RepID=UPI00193C9277|nr:uncharacterized protein LOC120350934 isoform X2 [Nilaparvata lugens]
MSKIDSSTHVVMIDDDCTDDESNSNNLGKLTLTFHPDETDPLDKEKMQRIWNYIESRQDFKVLMVTFRTAKTKKATAKKSQVCEKDSSQEASSGRMTEVMDMQEENLKKRPQTAIELIGQFQGLSNTVKGCLENFRKERQIVGIAPLQRTSRRAGMTMFSVKSIITSKIWSLKSLEKEEKNMSTNLIMEKNESESLDGNFGYMQYQYSSISVVHNIFVLISEFNAKITVKGVT